MSTFPPRASVSLPPAEGVIALWEVDEMARTRCPSPESCWPAARRPISETCPPGEGALICSWDGPLDCQAPAARQHAGRTPLHCWSTRPWEFGAIRDSALRLSLS